MTKSGTYGDAAELFAAAATFNITIHVLILSGCQGSLYQTINPGLNSEIFLAFNVALMHYGALIPIHDVASEDSGYNGDNDINDQIENNSHDGYDENNSGIDSESERNDLSNSPDASGNEKGDTYLSDTGSVDRSANNEGMSSDFEDNNLTPQLQHKPYGSSKPRKFSTAPLPGMYLLL